MKFGKMHKTVSKTILFLRQKLQKEDFVEEPSDDMPLTSNHMT